LADGAAADIATVASKAVRTKRMGVSRMMGVGPRARRGGQVRHLSLCAPLRFIAEITVGTIGLTAISAV
jgi:hypothetical protein